MRMDRRAGLLKRPLPPLAEVFADMVVVTSNYNNGNSSSNVVMRYSKNTTLYYFKVAATAFQIGKIYNDSFTWLNGSTTVPTLSEYSATLYSADTSLRGGIVMLVSIADYEEAVVDAVFSAIQETTIYNTVSSTTDAKRSFSASSVTNAGLYIAAFGAGYPFISISSSEDLYTPIFSYTSNTLYTDRVYLYKSGNYIYFSQSGTDNETTLYGARLSRIN